LSEAVQLVSAHACGDQA